MRDGKGFSFCFSAIEHTIGMVRETSIHGSASRQRFLVDAMLGDVARDLRLLGYDAELARDESDSALLRRAQVEERVLLTRDRHLAARALGLRCLLVSDTRLRPPVADVIAALGLQPAQCAFLSRCLACNSQLDAVAPVSASGLVPDHVALTSTRIWLCRGCRKTFWPGTHLPRLRARIQTILGALHSMVG